MKLHIHVLLLTYFTYLFCFRHEKERKYLSNLVQKFLRILDSISETGKKYMYFVKRITIYQALVVQRMVMPQYLPVNKYLVDDVAFFLFVLSNG